LDPQARRVWRKLWQVGEKGTVNNEIENRLPDSAAPGLRSTNSTWIESEGWP